MSIKTPQPWEPSMRINLKHLIADFYDTEVLYSSEGLFYYVGVDIDNEVYLESNYKPEAQIRKCEFVVCIWLDKYRDHNFKALSHNVISMLYGTAKHKAVIHNIRKRG